MARMFKPVIPGPPNNKKAVPQEKKGGKQGEDAGNAPKTVQKGRQ